MMRRRIRRSWKKTRSQRSWRRYIDFNCALGEMVPNPLKYLNGKC
jgi:uncharacterized protein YjiS (DUF1127 family)